MTLLSKGAEVGLAEREPSNLASPRGVPHPAHQQVPCTLSGVLSGVFHRETDRTVLRTVLYWDPARPVQLTRRSKPISQILVIRLTSISQNGANVSQLQPVVPEIETISLAADDSGASSAAQGQQAQLSSSVDVA